MRVLLYSISYSPEVAGSGRFNGELASWLSEHGHTVDVITALPYYPEWQVHQNYRGRLWFKEKKGSLTIYRTPLYVPKKVTGITRIVHELSFVIASLVYWVRALFINYDAVIAVCPPLQIGILPYLYGRLRNRPFIFHIQDLQVDAARNLGMIKNAKLLNILESVEKFLLRKADIVSSISEGMKRNILSKGVKEQNYFMLENWVDINSFKPQPVDRSLKKKLGFLPHDKIALYAGNIGEKQGLEVLIDAAEQLKQHSNIKIVVFGEGAARERLQMLATQKNLTNLIFFSIRPYEEMPLILSMADIHLVIQKRAASDLVMPSKLTGILATGGVSIVSADAGTSLSDVIIEYDLGWSIEPENPDKLAKAIYEAVYSSRLPAMQQNARNYAEKFLDREVTLRKYEQLLLSLCNNSARLVGSGHL